MDLLLPGRFSLQFLSTTVHRCFRLDVRRQTSIPCRSDTRIPVRTRTRRRVKTIQALESEVQDGKQRTESVHFKTKRMFAMHLQSKLTMAFVSIHSCVQMVLLYFCIGPRRPASCSHLVPPLHTNCLHSGLCTTLRDISWKQNHTNSKLVLCLLQNDAFGSCLPTNPPRTN